MNQELIENYRKIIKEIELINNNREEKGQNRVVLISVSKTKPVEMIQELYDAGCRDFGENKVQELVEKYEKLPKDINWHMIGHLQKNKVKYIIDKVALIHSVDSFELAKEINKQAVKVKKIMDILIEVNVAEEESKFGCKSSELSELVLQISELDHVRVIGLMTVAPYVENQEENRQYFVKLRELSVDITEENIDNNNSIQYILNQLSMGMTNDYQVACEEGATYIRVGSGIFGERQYT